MKSQMETIYKTTEVIVLLDRSGSMATIKNDMEKGFDSFLSEFKGKEGVFISLFEFNTEVHPVFKGKKVPTNMEDFPKLNLRPHGGTALYDAIEEVYLKTRHLKDCNKLLIIITDGEENSSKRNSASSAKEYLSSMKTNGFEITYLGANQDSFKEASKIGVGYGQTVTWNPMMAAATFALAGEQANNYARGFELKYTDQDRKKVS